MKSYSQRDKKWAEEPLGFSKVTTIGSHGCKCTCFSILDEERDPEDMNDIFKANNCYFGKNRDLLLDEACAKALGWEFKGKTTERPDFATLAEVDMSPAPGKQQHFVVYDPRGRIYDPWTGTRRSVKTYPILNYRLFVIPNEPPMSKIEISPKLRDALEKASGMELGDKINEEKEEPRLIEWLESITLMSNTVREKNQEIEALKKERSALQSRIATCQTTVLDKIKSYLNNLK